MRRCCHWVLVPLLQTISVALNLKTLGLSKIEVEDAITGEKVPADDGTFSVKIDFERYRLLKVMNQK